MSKTFVVVGDALQDRYWCGSADRLSAEAPIPVVKVSSGLVCPGGAANVAANLRALGATVIEVFGQGQPTKNRLMVGDTQVARWDEHDWCEPVDLIELNVALEQADALVVADYNKGSIDRAAISVMADIPAGISFIDTKRSPWDFWASATYFPNQTEYNQHLGAYQAQKNVVLKQGAEGLCYFGKGALEFSKLPARAEFVRSVNGAGDTVIAAFAYATIERGYTVQHALWYANVAAAVAVQKPYTSTVSDKEIQDAFRKQNCDKTMGI
jgi:D-beta-D-heptose 7-phosphate kinase/D-beta-D-heptose 1-phosphate adenosyltransferase